MNPRDVKHTAGNVLLEHNVFLFFSLFSLFFFGVLRVARDRRNEHVAYLYVFRRFAAVRQTVEAGNFIVNTILCNTRSSEKDVHIAECRAS